MSSLNFWRVKGGGFTGNGWVSAAFSPSSVDPSTVRYILTEIAARRSCGSSAATKPVLSDLRDRFHRLAVASHGHQAGAAGKSRSQRSCLTPWGNARGVCRCARRGENAIGEEIVADAIGAVEIERRRAGCGETDLVVFALTLPQRPSPLAPVTLIFHAPRGPGIIAGDSPR